MKLTTLFLIVCLFQIQANPSYSQDIIISINLQNESLENVLNRIETLTEYKFMYKDDDLNYKKIISITADKQPLSKILNQLFLDSNIDFKVLNKQIILKPKQSFNNVKINQITYPINGTVVDSDGQPLPGANVLEKGTKNVVITDVDGNFSIKLSNQNAILEVSFIGLITKEISIKGKTQIKIQLENQLSQLNEIVVIGYGKQTKETVVGSITQVKGDELLRVGNVATVSEALAGLMAGVSTQQAAGQPGATKSNILIRGQSTWGDNSPLYIVDGVERDFNSLDPNEIESISVLKDASATAVFGVKAANGVVVVTTKRGKSGKTKVSFTSSWGLKQPTMDTNYFADFATTMERYNEAALNDRAYDNLFPQSEIDKWRDPNRDKNFYSYTTWVKELLTQGTSSQYNINISGGNDFVTYFTSLGYQYDGDIMNIHKQADFDPRTYEKRYTWRSNLDFNFSKTTKFQVGLSGNFKVLNGNGITNSNNGSGSSNGGGDGWQRIWQTPLIGPAPILSDGRLTTEQGATVLANFLYLEKGGQFRRRSNTMYSDFSLIQDITKDLKAKGKLSYNFDQSYSSSIVKNLIYYYPNKEKTNFIQEGDPNAVQQPYTVNSEFITGSSNSLYYELALDYSKTIENHKLGALALFNRRKSQNGAAFPRYEEAWVGRATYGYKSKYLAEFNGAYTGNENWAPGLRFGFFPSMAVGWVMSSENFFKDNVKFIDVLKFRYSYGEIGSDKGIGNNRFLYQSQYENRNETVNYGDPRINYGKIYLEGAPATLDNTWETAIKQDLGIEFAVLNKRLKGTVELFTENRKGILMQRRTIAPWFGNTSPYANIGETKNHGIDIDLKWNAAINKNLSYFVNANMSLSESRVIKRDDPLASEPQARLEGKPIGWISGLIQNGLYQSWDDVYNNTISSFTTKLIPGSSNFVDYNGDGQINEFDKVPIKDPSYPAKTYAFSFGATYKNFTVHALFNGMFDISKYLSSNYLFEWDSASTLHWQLLNNEQMDAWSPQNPDGVHPALHLTNNSHDSQSSTYNNRSAAFLRFKTVEVKYKIGENLRNKIGLFDTFEVFVNGNNLYTWTNLPNGFDPEQSQLSVYPITKRYNLGIRLSF